MSLASLMSQTRLILGDQGESFREQIYGDGVETVFELPLFIDAGTFKLFRLSPLTELVEGTDYTLDARAGIVTFSAAPAEDEALLAEGKHYQEVTDEDLLIHLNAAVAKHLHGRDPMPYVDPGPGQLAIPAVEEHLIAIRATIEALWALATDASMDINIQTPDGVSIPRAQRFQQIMQMIQYWEAEYQSVASMLNVGLNRIEMFDLRRVSRTTNRLVPLYRPREYDDRKPPQRKLVPIDTGGGRLITYKGLYVASVDYAIDDIVDLLGQRYIAKQTNGPATTVVTPGTDTLVWEITTLNTGFAPGM